MNFDDTEYPISDVIPIPTAEFFPDDRVNLTPLQTVVPVKWEPQMTRIIMGPAPENLKIKNLNSNNGQRAVYYPTVDEIEQEVDKETIKENRRKKNSEAARLFRQRKKEYISGLEERVKVLEKENKVLQNEIKKLKEMHCQNPAMNQQQ
ncbi:Oidioi.mRNA.OKI2018_I69.chr2.g4343.t1.cds [Oikopleura dioica]|uniref:Oidioi.mRNA.OKI2018_I69.chr2.g4343.t1.cds n=1 Tax=Oikopleura dioica TaxID=34765 RepID=A0ABN7T2I0_OIKDI|nr:Oidioi.mRNA.OKI2018_I69.chr2.g4343.t1.cds [Oikopleura dioica]